MATLLFSLLTIAAIVLIGFTIQKAKNSPVKEFDEAADAAAFYLMETSDKNVRLTCRGYEMIGHKELGAKESSIEVVKVTVEAVNPSNLSGFTREDLYEIEAGILAHYPYASIEWKYPISKLVLTQI